MERCSVSRSNSEFAQPTTAKVQPRSFSNPQVEHPQQQPVFHDFSHVDLFTHAPQRSPVQMKPTLGEPNDLVEKDADRAIDESTTTHAPPDTPTPANHQLETKPVASFGRSLHDFSHVDLFTHAPQRSPVQMKPTLGEPNDHAEKDGDRVAEQVMSMAPPTTPNVQRQTDEEEVQTKPLAETITPLIQRQEESVQREGDASTTESASIDSSESPRFYTIRVQIPFYPPTPMENIREDLALRILRNIYNHLRLLTQNLEETLAFHQQLHEDQPIVGFLADTFGGTELPNDTLFIPIRVILDGALNTLEGGAVMPTARNLQRATAAWERADQALYEYREGTISGAERVQTTLEVVEVAGAIAATVATGGMASGGLVATAGASSVGAFAYGFLSEEGRQSGEMLTGMREEFDFGAIFRRATTDAVTTFVGAYVGGRLSQYMARCFGSYLASASDDLLIELGEQLGMRGPLPRDYFLTTGQRFLADFLGGLGSTPLTSAISVAIERYRGVRDHVPSLEEFTDQVFQEMVTGGIIQVLLGAVTHGHTSVPTGDGRGRTRRVEGEAHSTSSSEAVSHPLSTTETGTVEMPSQLRSPEAEDTIPEIPLFDEESTTPGETIPGEDTVVTTFDPGVSEYPEGLVHFGLSQAEARASYRTGLEVDPSREAGIWMDLTNGEYIVVQGGENFVATEWSIDPEFANRPWRLVEHFHPGSDSVARLASPNDFASMMHLQLTGQEPPGSVSTEIRWRDPESHIEFISEIGYNPDLPDPYWIRYRDVDGNWQVRMFEDTPWNAGSDYMQFLQEHGVSAADRSQTTTETPSDGRARLESPATGSLEGRRDYQVFDPTDPGRTITDIDRIESEILWEEKQAVDARNRLTGVDESSRWIDRHIRRKFREYLEARQHLPGYEDAAIGFHFVTPGADPTFREAVEAEVEALRAAHPNVRILTRWE